MVGYFPPFSFHLFFISKLMEYFPRSLNGCDSGSSGPNPDGCAHIEFDTVNVSLHVMRICRFFQITIINLFFNTHKGSGVDGVITFQSTFQAKGMLAESCKPTYQQVC